MKIQSSRFPNSVLNEEAKAIYDRLYGNDVAEVFLQTINRAPQEMAVISRMLCVLTDITKE